MAGEVARIKEREKQSSEQLLLMLPITSRKVKGARGALGRT